MVWDTASMKVAVVDDLPAISLSAETAKSSVKNTDFSLERDEVGW